MYIFQCCLAVITLLSLSCSAVQADKVLATAVGADESQLHILRSKIPQMAVVTPALMRGAQPPVTELPSLKKIGIKTIINLDTDELTSSIEERETGRLGIRYFHIPLTHFKIIPKDKIKQILEIIDDPVKQPVFLHCRQGQDRTGAMVAMYRIKEFGWSPTQAYREMLLFGFHPFFVPLTQSVFDFGKKYGHHDAMPNYDHVVDDLKQRARFFMHNLQL